MDVIIEAIQNLSDRLFPRSKKGNESTNTENNTFETKEIAYNPETRLKVMELVAWSDYRQEFKKKTLSEDVKLKLKEAFEKGIDLGKALDDFKKDFVSSDAHKKMEAYLWSNTKIKDLYLQRLFKAENPNVLDIEGSLNAFRIFKNEYETTKIDKKALEKFEKSQDTIDDQFKNIKVAIETILDSEKYNQSSDYIIRLLTFILYEENLIHKPQNAETKKTYTSLDVANALYSFFGYSNLYAKAPNDIINIQCLRRLETKKQSAKDCYIECLFFETLFEYFDKYGNVEFKIENGNTKVLTEDAIKEEPAARAVTNEELWTFITKKEHLEWFAKYRSTLKKVLKERIDVVEKMATTTEKNSIHEFKLTLPGFFELLNASDYGVILSDFSVCGFNNIKRKLAPKGDAAIYKLDFLMIQLYIYFSSLYLCVDKDNDYNTLADVEGFYSSIDDMSTVFYRFSLNDKKDRVCNNFRVLIENIKTLFDEYRGTGRTENNKKDLIKCFLKETEKFLVNSRAQVKKFVYDEFLIEVQYILDISFQTAVKKYFENNNSSKFNCDEFVSSLNLYLDVNNPMAVYDNIVNQLYKAYRESYPHSNNYPGRNARRESKAFCEFFLTKWYEKKLK